MPRLIIPVCKFVCLPICLIVCLLCCTVIPARAQGSYTTTQTLTLSGATPCATPSTRTIQVADNFAIADVQLGFLATHTWRGDIRLDLVSPQGTRVRLIDTDTQTLSTDNYNVLLSDAAPAAINNANHRAGPDGTAAPPFENDVRPDTPLSAFDNQQSAGTWTLEMCDAFPTADNGTFQRATLILTPVAAPPATPLACAAGAPNPLAWTAPGGTVGWPAGDLTPQSYAVAGDDVTFTLSGDTAAFIPRNGTNTPVTSTAVSGGTGQFALVSNIDYATRTQSITYTIALGTPGLGVGGLQFRIFDLDARPGAWQDSVSVSASLGGAAVPLTLSPTNGANYLDGNTLIGLSEIDSASAGAEGVVTVTQPLDTLVLTRTPGPRSPANPASQVMSFSLFDICPAPSPDLVASKVFSVAGGGFAIPGSEVVYTISVDNLGTATTSASDITLSDTLPGTLVFVSAQATGFQGGAFAPPLPGPETDCANGACVVSYDGATLPVGASASLVITARLK